MELRFGRHRFSVDLPETITDGFPKQWSRFIVDDPTPARYRITVKIDDLGSCFLRQPHWESHAEDGKEVSTYFDNRRACFSLTTKKEANSIQLTLPDGSFRALQLGLHYSSMCLLYAESIGLHCATVICGDQAIVLSAPSGTGKSTLARLLVQHGDAAIVNGDFALLSVNEDHQVIFEPTPFCGTSGIAFNARIPISRVVFLEQAAENSMQPLDTHTAFQRLLSNVFVPDWDPNLSNGIIGIAAGIVESIPMSVFAFEPSEHAVEKFYQEVFK